MSCPACDELRVRLAKVEAERTELHAVIRKLDRDVVEMQRDLEAFEANRDRDAAWRDW